MAYSGGALFGLFIVFTIAGGFVGWGIVAMKRAHLNLKRVTHGDEEDEEERRFNFVKSKAWWFGAVAYMLGTLIILLCSEAESNGALFRVVSAGNQATFSILLSVGLFGIYWLRIDIDRRTVITWVCFTLSTLFLMAEAFAGGLLNSSVDLAVGTVWVAILIALTIMCYLWIRYARMKLGVNPTPDQLRMHKELPVVYACFAAVLISLFSSASAVLLAATMDADKYRMRSATGKYAANFFINFLSTPFVVYWLNHALQAYDLLFVVSVFKTTEAGLSFVSFIVMTTALRPGTALATILGLAGMSFCCMMLVRKLHSNMDVLVDVPQEQLQREESIIAARKKAREAEEAAAATHDDGDILLVAPGHRRGMEGASTSGAAASIAAPSSTAPATISNPVSSSPKSAAPAFSIGDSSPQTTVAPAVAPTTQV